MTSSRSQPPEPAAGRHQALLDALKANREHLGCTLADADAEWVRDDLVYRFWHQSFKVYALQDVTVRIVAALETAAPAGWTLHPWLRELVATGGGKRFEPSHNDNWVAHTRPIVDAYFHARHLIELAVRCADELDEAPTIWLPPGWATLLELYQVR